MQERTERIPILMHIEPIFDEQPDRNGEDLKNMTDIEDDQNYDKILIQDDIVIVLSETEIKNTENTFKKTIKEETEQNHVEGFIDRLNHGQRIAFEKIINLDNKNIIILGITGL